MPHREDFDCMIVPLSSLQHVRHRAETAVRVGSVEASNIPDAMSRAVEHHRSGELRAATEIYRQILAVNVDCADAWHLLGIAAYQSRDHAGAIDCIGRAVKLLPDRADFLCNLGAAFHATEDLPSARATFEKALQLNPRCATTCSNLGNVLKDCGLLDEAMICYRRALEIDPESEANLNNLAVTLTAQGLLNEAVACYEKAVQRNPRSAQIHSNLLYTLNFCSDLSPETIYEEHRRWETRHALPLADRIPTHENDRSPDRRLRIGYVSPDFRRHPVGLFVLPLLANHDREKFEVFCYSAVVNPDEITDHCRTHSHVWREIKDKSDDQVFQTILGDQIDILIDLTMHMPGNRLLVFARKPAPIQVTYLAYCGTTGLGTIDYRFTDLFLDPSGGNDQLYSEESVRLPTSYWCYPDRGPIPAVVAPPVATQGFVTFGCLNNLSKMSCHAIDAWSRILVTLPETRLLLHAHPGSHRERVRDEFGRRSIAGDRLEFIGYQPTAEYLRTYNRIDIALDPFPIAGGTTSCDSLWMGVPIVTLAGPHALGRSGVSILSNIELRELIAPSIDRYVQIAVELARDLPRLKSLRANLRTIMLNSNLMNASVFANHVELAYRRMWLRWQAGD